jgi:hypothetical protein
MAIIEMPFDIMTLNITAFSIMTIMTHSMVTFSILIISKMIRFKPL